MTPQDWMRELAPSIKNNHARRKVVEQVRIELELAAPAELSTAELVERMYPLKLAIGEAGIRARQRIFDCLMSPRERDLGSFWRYGPPRENRFKQMIRPKLWSWAPPAQGTSDEPAQGACVVCPHCHKEIW